MKRVACTKKDALKSQIGKARLIKKESDLLSSDGLSVKQTKRVIERDNRRITKQLLREGYGD